MAKIDPTKYVRPTTAARIIGCHRSRIDQLLTAGELPFVTIDGVRFILRTAAQKRANTRQEQEPPTPA